MECCCVHKDRCHLRPAEKELCQLKLNWCFLFILGGLASVSYTSVLYSFHQFITNPTSEQLKNTSQEDVTPGLGQSEAFYSWVLMVFHGGATCGALLAALLVRVFPYWYLLLFSLTIHTLSYIMYGMATSGWIIALSKFLSGLFIGMEKTVTFAYFGESYNDYLGALEELGREESKRTRMKDRLFALHSIGVNIGFLVGPALSVVITHFDVDQFRTVAWYNAAGGILLIMLQFILFHGVRRCHTLPHFCKSCPWKLPQVAFSWKVSLPALLTIVFLISGRSILSARYCVYEALFNPVLSDSFGFREKEDAYMFLGLVVLQILGALVLILLQHLKLNNRLTAVIGIVMSMVACALLADWQAIPYDQCTEYSLFHHPELALNLTQGPVTLQNDAYTCKEMQHVEQITPIPDNLEMFVFIPIEAIHPLPTIPQVPARCRQVQECATCYGYPQNSTLCLHFTAHSSKLCLVRDASSYVDFPSKNPVAYQCVVGSSVVLFCMDSSHKLPSTAEHIKAVHEMIGSHLSTVHSQSLLVVERYTYQRARENCEDHSEHSCHWIPDSLITKKHCYDCQPICRSMAKTLTFAQFCVGAAILMLSIPIGRESLTAVISDNATRALQGLALGAAVALAGVWRGVSLIWLEGAYEVTGKRTYTPMILMAASLLLVLVGLVALYRKLGNRQNSKANSDSGDEDSVSEGTKLVASERNHSANK